MSHTDKTDPIKIHMERAGISNWRDNMDIFGHYVRQDWMDWDKVDTNSGWHKHYVEIGNSRARREVRDSLRKMVLMGNYDNQPEPTRHRHNARWLSS